ncbi:MAG: TIR domain-containing protein [Candidatus Brocadiaceae bacterium]|nr:TIR domain-containing protein [Candidatus Brocadiaceae bacterium]
MDKPIYDISLSFAGEDRDYVEAVATALRQAGVKVFYDKHEEAEMWGKDLYRHLDEVYRKQSKYCVVFASKNYAKKLWTNHELRSAQARALEKSEEYILPARFDDTDIPGLPQTVSYISLQQLTPDAFSSLVLKKLGIVSSQRDVNPFVKTKNKKAYALRSTIIIISMLVVLLALFYFYQNHKNEDLPDSGDLTDVGHLEEDQESSSGPYNPRSTADRTIFSRGAAAQEFVRVAYDIKVPTSVLPGEFVEVGFILREHITLENLSPIYISLGRLESESYAPSVCTDFFKPRLGENRLIFRLPSTASPGHYIIHIKMFVGKNLAMVKDPLDPTLDVTLYLAKKNMQVPPISAANDAN